MQNTEGQLKRAQRITLIDTDATIGCTTAGAVNNTKSPMEEARGSARHTGG